MKFYHASDVANLKELAPQQSNYIQNPTLFFSTKIENVLIYLANPVKKFYEEKYGKSNQIFQKFATYGFNKEKLLFIDEYYPNALQENFGNVSGYIYEIETESSNLVENKIPFVYSTNQPQKVINCTYIPNALDLILDFEQKGLIKINRYETLSEKKMQIIKQQIKDCFAKTDDKIFKEFLIDKFPNFKLEQNTDDEDLLNK